MGESLSFIGVDFWTALFTLLNFLAVFFVGKRFLWGPVMKIITDRQKEIDDLYADAGAARENALAMQSEYEEKLAAAAQTSEQMVSMLGLIRISVTSTTRWFFLASFSRFF